MGGRAGGGPGGRGERDTNYKGKIENVEGLKNMLDRKLYNEMGKAISRYYNVMGIKEKQIMLADLDNGVYGIQATTSSGQLAGIYLNKAYFKSGTVQSVKASVEKDYSAGWATKTNKAVAHTLTHELAHSTWNTSLKGANQIAAGKEIKALYKAWSGDNRKVGYGKYAESNVNEFWAETVTKGIHGKSDKYTKAAIGIARKYQL